MQRKILIVDDQPEIVELLKLYLEKDGYIIEEAFDGAEAIENIKNNSDIDLILVDLMMPKIDGFEFIKTVRVSYHLPIIIISAKNEDNDKILGFGLGADDFIAKPFNPLEVVARVQAHLRRKFTYSDSRSNVDLQSNESRIQVGNLVLDEETFCIIQDGETKTLTRTEYMILELLMSSPGRVYTKQQIFEKVWNDYYLGGEEDNTINVHMSKIREKIEANPRSPKYIKTIRGLGYKFEKIKEN